MKNNEKAVALVIIIFLMMLLSGLGWTLAVLMSTDFDANTRNLDSERALSLAEAGINEAISWIGTTDTKFDADTDVLNRTLGLGQYQVIRSTVNSTITITSTGYIPTIANYRAKRTVQVVAGSSCWTNAINGGNLFDWSEMTPILSWVFGDVQAKYYDGDDDATYNEHGSDYDNPPTAKPWPWDPYYRDVAANVSLPEINLEYYKDVANNDSQYMSAPYVYVAGIDGGLSVIDNNFTNPTRVGYNITGGTVYDVGGYFTYSSRNYTCVVDNQASKQFKVMNITSGAAPRVADDIGLRNTPEAVCVNVENANSASEAYAAIGTGGFQVIGISNPTNINYVNNTTSIGGGNATDLCARGDYLYLAAGSVGLRIYDISNPARPSLTGTRDTTDARGVCVRGRFAFVADGTAGLQVIDVYNPSSPAITKTCNTPGTANKVKVRGNYAFVADGSSGLQIINITNIVNSDFSPSIVGSYSTSPYEASDVQISGNYAYVTGRQSGGYSPLFIIDVTSPVAPALSDRYDTATGDARGVLLAGDRTFSGNYNNDKVWYTKGNAYIYGGNYQKTTIISEGDIDIVGTGGLVMRAHVDTSANENFPNVATQYGSIIASESAVRLFDGLVYSQHGCIDFNTVGGVAAMAPNIYMAGVCIIYYNDKYVGTPPSGLLSGASASQWEEL